MAKLNVDLRLVEARFEIPALRASVQTLEEQLEYLAAQRRQHVIADLGPDPDEDSIQVAFQVLSHEVEHTYPRIYRGALLLLIWASYESVIAQVADFVRERKNIGLTLSETRARGVLDQAKLYFAEVLDFQLFATLHSNGRLREIHVLRNAFAHTGGRVSGLKDAVRRTVRALERSGWVEEEWGHLVPTKKCLQTSLSVVDSEVSSLLGRAIAWDDSRDRGSVATS